LAIRLSRAAMTTDLPFSLKCFQGIAGLCFAKSNGMYNIKMHLSHASHKQQCSHLASTTQFVSGL